MRVRFLGTYDERRHPRVRVLREGLTGVCAVDEVNVPVAIDTAMRVDALREPVRLLGFLPVLLWAWLRLAARSLRGPRPDVVLVGHLGHFDVLLARLLHPGATIVLDYLISLADTARDRTVGDRGVVHRMLQAADRLATGVADVVVVDTPESIETVPVVARDRTVVVPVGADASWFAAAETRTNSATERARGEQPLSVVFFGLYTPLQGAPVIGAALQVLHERGVAVRATMIGDGQERPETQQACPDAPVDWIDWVEAERLPGIVAAHDVCLGIFGTGAKAGRVVPNKLYQGAAAGCVVVTSDTPPQRRAFPDSHRVPPGDARALADVLTELAADTSVRTVAHGSRVAAAARFRPRAVVEPLLGALDGHHSNHDTAPRTGEPSMSSRTNPVDPPLTPRAWLRHDLIRDCLEDLPPSARVLEVGAGQGAWAVRLARAYDYTGIEADEVAAATARQRLEAAGVPHRLHVTRYEDAPLDPPYDAVCAFEVLEHLEHDDEAAAAWLDLLAPGGRLVLSVPAWQDKFGTWDHRVGHYRRYSPSELDTLLRRTGFVDVRIDQYGFLLGTFLEEIRNRIADRQTGEVGAEADEEQRTAQSGRLLQPDSRVAAVVTDLATRPFRALQRRVGDDRRGTGLVASARRPG